MRWLLITTIGRNPGDEWIRIGIQNIIRKIDPEKEYILLDKESSSMRATQIEFDKCIWCGMPIFWSQGNNCNSNISWWKELMLNWPSQRPNDFMVLGAGSFFPWRRELKSIGDEDRLVQSAEDILKRSFCVTARDTVVPKVTKRQIDYMICPAIFSILDYRRSHEMKLANIMPNGAHYTCFGPKEAAIWNEKKIVISDILRNSGFVFVAHDLVEFQFAQRRGWKKIVLYNGNPYELLEHYGRCGKYFGNRVHGAIVARGNDADTWSVGYDSRQEAVRLSGARVTRPSELDIQELEDWASREFEIEQFDMKSNFEMQAELVERFKLAGKLILSKKQETKHDKNLPKEIVNTMKKANIKAVNALSSDCNIFSTLFANLNSDVSTKQRVLKIISRLTRDHWLDRNIEMFKLAICYNSKWFNTLSFLNWFAENFKPANYLEVGVRRGRSMAQVLVQSPLTEAYGFDSWIKGYSGTPNPGPDFVISELTKLGINKEPIFINGDSHVTLPKFWADPNNPQKFELILVDGDHSYEGAKEDLDICLAHLAPGGALVFDDINHHLHPELRHLWQEYKSKLANFLFIEHTHGNGTGIAFKSPFIKLKQYLFRSFLAQDSRYTLMKPKNILLIRPDSIGDYVIFSGILYCFRQIYKDAIIHVLLQDHIVELAQTCPHIDEVIGFNRTRIISDQLYCRNLVEQLKTKEFDISINPVYSRDEVGDFLALNSGAETTIASVGDESNIAGDKKHANDFRYTQLISASVQPMLETVRNVEFINNLARINICKQCSPKVWIKREDEVKIEKLLNEISVKDPIVICPFSQHTIKDWPLWKWAKLLVEYKDRPVLICGSEKNENHAERLISQSNHSNLHNLCGRITLRQLAALLAKSHVCIGVDTGSIHIAEAVNCPQVVIVGGGHFGRFMPYSSQTRIVNHKMDCYFCNWECKFGKDIRCISNISVDMVRNAVDEVLRLRVPSLNFCRRTSIDSYKQEVTVKCNVLVSAIVSTYNSEKFLRGCIEDLENQTIADRLEIIIINSGSQTNEETIVREYQDKYNNITYIKTEYREGIYAAWNRAVKIARGTFLTNANTDDRHREDALERMAEILMAYPDVALVYGDQICTDTANGTFADHHPTETVRRPGYSRERLLFGCCVGSQPMWRKSLHNEFGYFDETLTCAGDWDFWLRISSKYKFKHIPEFLGLYYNNKEGIEHGRRIHSLYERYIVGQRYGNPYISVIPQYKSKENPLVSIIIPTYNAADYIAEAIESILIQNYRNFELLIVDDGSEDDTRAIISGFADEKISYFYKENAGPASARNLAIKESKGNYIALLDADDMMTPDFLARHLQEFESNQWADLIYCDDLLIDKNLKPIRVIKRPEYTERRSIIRDMFHRGFPVVPFRTCIRRSVFDKIGLYDEDLLVGEDYDMMRRFIGHGLNIHHLKDPLYLRRITGESLSRSHSLQKARSHFDVVRRFMDTFSPDELFPDIPWSEIPRNMRQLQANCLAVVTYLAIGQAFMMSNSPGIYIKVAFESACSQLNNCLRIDPGNVKIQELLNKCERGRQQYSHAVQEV